MSLAIGLSDKLRHSRPVEVLERSLEKNRLAHAILLHGGSLTALAEVARAITNALLSMSSQTTDHPDLFTLRPSGRARQIRVEDTRRLIRAIQHSPNRAERKVAVIYEADRMNAGAANAFLKTLEEPPADTTVLLLSTRPYDLLATIRSRCFNFRLPIDSDRLNDSRWAVWLHDYVGWLERLLLHPRKGPEVAQVVMALYGLVTRFLDLLESLADDHWKGEKTSLPEGIEEEEREALRTGFHKGIRQRMLGDLEQHTHNFAFCNEQTHDPLSFNRLASAIDELEQVVGLLEVNLNEGAALEKFLLASLRIWSSPE